MYIFPMFLIPTAIFTWLFSSFESIICVMSDELADSSSIQMGLRGSTSAETWPPWRDSSSPSDSSWPYDSYQAGTSKITPSAESIGLSWNAERPTLGSEKHFLERCEQSASYKVQQQFVLTATDDELSQWMNTFMNSSLSFQTTETDFSHVRVWNECLWLLPKNISKLFNSVASWQHRHWIKWVKISNLHLNWHSLGTFTCQINQMIRSLELNC